MTRRNARKAWIALADGTVFEGCAAGAAVSDSGATPPNPRETTGEVVFTTGMTGYQEVLTDPSYCGQIVVMTAPEIGNTGATTEDDEAGKPWVAGFVMHELSPMASNWRSQETLDAYLRRHGVVAIDRVDTRALTRHIRDHGAQSAVIGTSSPEALVAKAKAAPSMAGQDLTGAVTTREPYVWAEGAGVWHTPEGEPTRHVVAVDFGVKKNILRCLVDHGCRVTVVPATTSAKDILAHDPDGVFISNGPGDPAAVAHGIETVRELVGQKPLFGICLGHQMLALALGGKTYKMKFGHRGLNHPVKDLSTGRVEITTQNHGFAVDAESLAGKCDVTHVHLNDGTCMGLEHRDSGAFSVQYHPEASAGPHDARYLFKRFVERMDAAKR
ncbi:glutamine-hydrolyzing carbamoyl-phosphate synthase small subunit [Sandaracinus amylolyticus]|uniref:glutamine-hydrolyzing carbamoyl-phosphate synthase small subunit n=1 Tax=Sandaracinus amylolyticus TaxID=927083 RepID=UPI001F027643|nr:glutamine-hydrolyzing carbamoyl-phosphate synthase small subunit [Sandaracinus amylolyticus]UJR81068.1 Glutamine-hydrolyzing carbamoyl-phosphate synthase small subunit [Sandaracinus amylolyticus]